MRRSTAGFTLIEVMIAALIGAISIAVAAKVAQVVVKQSAQSRERTDFHTRSRALTRQLRADLRVAGLGSTGAVAFDPLSGGVLAGGGISFATINGYAALPAVTGINGVGTVNIGGTNTLAGSDVIQLIVPDASTAVKTSRPIVAGNSLLPLQFPVGGGPFVVPPSCTAPGSMVYVVDHTAPTSAGRAQVAFVAAWAPGTPSITLLGGTMFGTAPGTQVMCARISTYWVDDQGWIHRSDLNDVGDPATPVGGLVVANSATAPTDAVSPGVIDMQIAYGMSAEWQRLEALAASPVNRFMFDGALGTGITQPDRWTEVRVVRVNLLTRTLRRQDVRGGTAPIVPREDGAPPALAVSQSHQVEWITTAETLNNLNFFDEIAPQGMPAEPF